MEDLTSKFSKNIFEMNTEYDGNMCQSWGAQNHHSAITSSGIIAVKMA